MQPFGIEELIIHKKYKMGGTDSKVSLTTNQSFLHDSQGRKTERDDYDIALLRLDYPIMDEGTGATVLPGNKFDMNTLMPICLPKNKGQPE